MPPKLDPHITTIENWLATEPQLTALAIVSRLSDKYPEQFGKKQHSIVQPLLKSLRNKAAKKLFTPPGATITGTLSPGAVDGSGYGRARPVHSPLAHSSLESLDAARIGRPRIVSNAGDSVTFPDAAIRGVKIGRRFTMMVSVCASRVRFTAPSNFDTTTFDQSCRCAGNSA
jgi:hypothetical protein